MSQHPATGLSLTLSPDSLSVEPAGPPRVEVELERDQYPADRSEVFQPMRLPERCRLKLGGALARCLQSARLRVTLRLRPGYYNLPLGDQSCQLELPPGAQAFGRIELGAGPGEDVPSVLALDLHFQPPLLIHNLLQTLTGLHDVVEDRTLALLRPVLGQVPPWLRQLGGVAVGSADSAATILLEQATARPRWTGEPWLRFAFTGRVRWLGQMETRFERVTLPATLLPAPCAHLERLLSARPLATAELRRRRQDPLEIAETVRHAVDWAEVEILGAELAPPVLHLKGSTLDGTVLQARFRSGSAARLSGSLRALAHGQILELSGEKLTLTPRQGEGSVQLDLQSCLKLDLSPGERPWRERAEGGLELSAREGSRWPALEAELSARDRVAVGETDLPLLLTELGLNGGVALDLGAEGLRLRPATPLVLSGQLRSREPFRRHRARSDMTGTLEAALQASMRPLPDGDWETELRGQAFLASTELTRIAALPELDIDRGVLVTRLRVASELELRPRVVFGASRSPSLDLSGSRAALRLERAEMELGPRRLALPEGTAIALLLLDGGLSPAGLQGFAIDLRWDLHGQPCLLHHGERAVSLLTEELRRGEMRLLLDRSGKLSFSGDQERLYGARYFNTLLNPAGDPERLVDLLLSQDALNHVLGALGVFAPGAAEALTDLRALWLAARRIFQAENIRQPKDVIPRKKMARLLSLLLAGDDRLQARLEPVIQGVTDGKGLDVGAAREILLQELGELDIEYEITALLNWLDLVLSPSEPCQAPEAELELPIDIDPAHAGALAGLPSAAEIYAAVNRGALDREWLRRLADLAPRLARRQLAFILARAAPGNSDSLCRIRYAYEVKTRVEALAEHYGGFEYLLQPATIASFIGEAVGPLPGINHPSPPDERAWPPPCALGPEDIAVLLQAGLATGRQGRRTQINNRLLLELLRRQPPELTREVLIELGHQSPRALSGILYAFLDQDQDQLLSALDLCELLSERLGVPVPRQRDFMAGGSKARQSYVEALTRVADHIIEEAGPYLARKAHLQVMRHPTAPELLLTPPVEELADRARQAIGRADELGAACCFDGRRGGPRQQARKAYLSAFRACARLLQQERRAFQLPWLRDFWLRNEEALRVLSVVRGYQEDRDRDRTWMTVRSGRQEFTDDQDLAETVVRVLYSRREHQERLLADPLNRLLIDPPDGHYAFTIVSCMGVITDGVDGAELVDAYRRLEERRGIRVVRAHTGIARSLEYNAARIIEAIETCTTPWGIIGYSQGCANALMAESMLLGGTPEEQRLLDGLVCRNFLFSAANGSAHGTSGSLKFMRALVLGERYLKHYQAIYSWEAIKAVLRIVRAVLDSRLFVAVLGGVHSLSFERARLLHRDGQFRDGVPTTITRGVVAEDQLPETLEYLYYVLRELTAGAEQDTQVLVTDAVGSSTRVRNAAADVLARCDMQSYPQATHHWAPLTREIEFVTTERDLARAVYMSPKDRLVWPWVEVNARFGLIRPQ